MIQSDHPAGKRMTGDGLEPTGSSTADAPPAKGPRCPNFYVAFGTFVGI
jgi:hypothetical protein